MRALIDSVLAAPSGNAPRLRTGYSDIVLAFAAVTIISVMILPLPVVAIDTLVAINISIGFGLLLLAIYIPTPVAFSSFPSVLLLTTLFRLSLSIAITRSILLNAEGGHIVQTFGTLVAGGNLVVGPGGVPDHHRGAVHRRRQGRRTRGRGRRALHPRRDARQAAVDRLRPARPA